MQAWLNECNSTVDGRSAGDQWGLQWRQLRDLNPIYTTAAHLKESAKQRETVKQIKETGPSLSKDEDLWLAATYSQSMSPQKQADFNQGSIYNSSVWNSSSSSSSSSKPQSGIWQPYSSHRCLEEQAVLRLTTRLHFEELHMLLLQRVAVETISFAMMVPRSPPGGGAAVKPRAPSNQNANLLIQKQSMVGAAVG